MDKKALLPVSLQRDKNVEALSESIDKVFVLNNSLNKLLIYPRIDSLTDEVLDLLAWQFHVEGYEYAHDIEAKRSLIKQAIEIHRIKGTLAGVKKAFELSRAKLLRIYTPHHRTFLSLSMTDEERKDWLRQFPELRIIHFVQRGRGRRNKFLNRFYPYVSDAFARYGIKAYFVKQGKVLPLYSYDKTEKKTTKTAVEIIEVRKQGQATGIFYRRKDRFLFDHMAKDRIYNLRLSREYTDIEYSYGLNVIYPELSPLSAKYDEVYEKGKYYRKTAFCYMTYGHTCISDAENRIYRSIRVYDESVTLKSRRPYTYLNEKPIQIPPFSAILKGKIRGTYRFLNFPRSQNMINLKRTVSLLREFKAERDRFFLDTVTKRLPTADGTITAGMNISLQEEVNV